MNLSLVGTLVVSWSLTHEVSGWNPFTVMTSISVKTLGKTQICLVQTVLFHWKKITGHISQILVEGESSRGPLTLVLSSYVTTTWRIILKNVNITIPNIFLVSPFKIENDIRVFTNTQHSQQCQYELQILYYVNTKKHTPFWTNLLICFWDWDFRMGGIYFKIKPNDMLASNFQPNIDKKVYKVFLLQCNHPVDCRHFFLV